jgi:phage tail sheath gpL-like
MGITFDDTFTEPGEENMPVTGLLIGQKTSAGTATAGVLTLVTSADQARNLGGAGSQAYWMAQKWFDANAFTPLYMVFLDDPAGTAKTWDSTGSGTVSGTGTLAGYLNGKRYAVAGVDGETVADLVTAFVAEMATDPDLPVVPTTDTLGGLTFTQVNVGLAAGDFDFRWNMDPGDEFPTGISFSAPVEVDGTLDPDLQTALDAVGDTWANVIAQPYTDSSNLDALETWLDEQADSMVQRWAKAYTAKRGTVGELITYATAGTRNSQYVSTMDAGGLPAGVAEYAAQTAALVAGSVADDVSVPLQNMTYPTIKPVEAKDRRSATEANQLATNGIATIANDVGVRTQAMVTMKLTNDQGAPTTKWQQQNKIFQLMYAAWSFRTGLQTQFPRAKLADSAENVEEGQSIITPEVGRTYAVAWFKALATAGHVENVAQFKRDVQCLRDTGNDNRLNWFLPNDFIDFFIVGSGVIQFR